MEMGEISSESEFEVRQLYHRLIVEMGEIGSESELEVRQ